MQPLSYRDRVGRRADFRVRYRFLSEQEGGRRSLPRQHIRSDFLYEGDDPIEDGIWCIWPEFLSVEGEVIAEGQQVLAEGFADMYVLNKEMRSTHKPRVQVGTKGYFVEGVTRTGTCEVVEVGSLLDADL
jgi:hypothetical protein